MKYAELAEAFSIFAKYEAKLETVGIEYGELTVGPFTENFLLEDVARLEKLGWNNNYDWFSYCE